MDEFVRNKLTEWGFSELSPIFKVEEIDQEALCNLNGNEIDKYINTIGKRTKFKTKLKLFQSQQECQEQAHSSQRKRKSVYNMEEDTQTANKRRCNTVSRSSEEDKILGEVKGIMRDVNTTLQNNESTELNVFLREKISGLDRDKREMIGVFGKTGAGKSTLINALIGEKNLLPSGSGRACTTVMIKVEANMLNQKYEAHIEFITQEEWEDELWIIKNFSGDNGDEDNDNGDEDNDNGDEDNEDEENKSDKKAEYMDSVEKLTAVYGDQWRDKPPENLMDAKYFKDVPEFLKSKEKILSCDSAEELSARYLKYTRSGSTKDKIRAERLYWPLVKCVTVKVPNNDLLQHVTLVDLPGNGDRNKGRDQMWKRIVGSCSTVWILAETNRAASEREGWEILETTCSLLGNGGECQNIHFICTKTDDIFVHPGVDVGRAILNKNMDVKDEVREEFNKLKDVKKQFRDDCFKVFTVSTKAFENKTHLKPEETGIPDLKRFLQDLNDLHSETLNYILGAYGILSLMKAAHHGDAANKASVHAELMGKLTYENEKVGKVMEDAIEVFKKHLDAGVEKSKKSCEPAVKKILYPHKQKGSAFHKTLKCVVKNNGTHKPVNKKKKEINFNMTLSSRLFESIDEEFKNTFPNDRKSGSLYRAVNRFTLNTDKLITNHKDVELQLIFLKTEEEKMKAELCRIIRDRKKDIYNCLTKRIGATMQDCYTRAAKVSGNDSLKNMRNIIENHVEQSKATMFDSAKDDMLTQLRQLKWKILNTLDTMQKSIDLSLKTNDNSIPDVSGELSKMEHYYQELKAPDDNSSMFGPPNMSCDPLDSLCSAAEAEMSD